MATINEVYAYEPPGMPGHPEYGLLVRVTGLLYDPRTATARVQVSGSDGRYAPTEDVFERDYVGPLKDTDGRRQ